MRWIAAFAALAWAGPGLSCVIEPPSPDAVQPTRVELLEQTAAQTPNIVYGVVERTIRKSGEGRRGVFRVLRAYKGDLLPGEGIPMEAIGRPDSCHFGPARVRRGTRGTLFLPRWDRRSPMMFDDFIADTMVEEMVDAGILPRTSSE